MARSRVRDLRWLLPRAAFIGAGVMIGIAVGLYVRVDTGRPLPVAATPFRLVTPAASPVQPPPSAVTESTIPSIDVSQLPRAPEPAGSASTQPVAATPKRVSRPSPHRTHARKAPEPITADDDGLPAIDPAAVNALSKTLSKALDQ